MRTRRLFARPVILLSAVASLCLLAPLRPQQPVPAPQSQAPGRAQASPPSGPPLVLSPAEQSATADAIREDAVRQQLQGKTFYLRRGYLGDTLHFNSAGALDGTDPAAPYTLSLVEIERVHLEKHRIELDCIRYGLHFLGALPTEDQTEAVDRVRLSAKKKPLKITIDREEVSKPKKEKEPKHGKARPSPIPQTTEADAPIPGSAHPAPDTKHGRLATSSDAQANIALARALDNVFTAAIDQRMIATLPEYWRLFYESAAAHRLFHPADPAVLRQSDVDSKARLVSIADPQSNEYAQKNGVAGIAMYSVVVGPDGKPQQIAIARPIGFGLDENAVAAIRKAAFQPAVKNGHAVPVLLDVVVRFRIYSGLTAAESATNTPRAPQTTILPGPYTANAPPPQPPAATERAQPPAAPAENAQPAAQPVSAPAPQPQAAPQPAAPQPGGPQ